MSTNKNLLNNTIVNISIMILLVILILIIFFSLFIWKKRIDWLSIISISLCILGTIFNIYLLSKEK